MDYINLNDTKVPKLGFGTWQMTGQECVNSVKDAIEIGYRHIDTAQVYENEAEVGTGIKESGIARDDIFLTTKIWRDYFEDGKLQDSLDESLKKLKTDYVDLLLLHWPFPECDLDEAVKAIMRVKDSGKAKHIGISNFTVSQMKHAVDDLNMPAVTNQVEYHPFLKQDPVLAFCQKHDMFLTAYSPIARGKVMKNDVLQNIGRTYGKSPAQITLRWLIQQDQVVAIPKAASREHAESNFNIFDFELSDEEMSTIKGLARPDGRLISPEWAPQWDTGLKKAA